MLKIETLTAERIKMEKTLKQSEKKWIQSDTIDKNRRIMLNYMIDLNQKVSE